MRAYVISRQASLDIGEIVDFLSDRDLETGEAFLKAFAKKCRYLTQFPFIGKSYPHIQAELRGLIFRRYIIFYVLTYSPA
jgi:toxin ParE1/3/4